MGKRYFSFQICIVLLFLVLLIGCVDKDCSCPTSELPYKHLPLKKFAKHFTEITKDSTKERQLRDNLIYKPNYHARYSYTYNIGGLMTKFCLEDFIYKTHLHKRDSCDDANVVEFIDILVPGRTPLNYHSWGEYTPYKIYYLNRNLDSILVETTGLIENFKCVMLHPFRGGLCFQTFNAPWPVVYWPLTKGHKVEFLDKPNFLSPNKGSSEFLSNQIVVADCEKFRLNDNMDINTVRIEYSAKSSLLNFSGYYLFSPDFGFVKFYYQLPDGGELTISLHEYFE